MAVLKNKTQGNFTMVSQSIMRDSNLSLTERGMLLTLLSLPDNWHLTIMGLCQILPDGKDKIAKTLNSLIEKGYVSREQSRGDRGKFDSSNIEVHQSPVKRDISPFPEKPHAVKQDAENRCAENPPQYNTYISNINKDYNNKVCRADTLTDSEYEDLVAEFGKGIVDNQIKRIKDNNYKGCCNYETIRSWCKERADRKTTSPSLTKKKNSFFDFEQRSDYDMEAIERELVCN